VPRACEDYGKYSFYVYFQESGQPHKYPHCHVRWPDDECVLQLPLLSRLAGPLPPRDVLDYVIQHLEEIIELWNRLNPDRMATYE
jgi:Domain of unknown function (DUF4160)